MKRKLKKLLQIIFYLRYNKFNIKFNIEFNNKFKLLYKHKS